MEAPGHLTSDELLGELAHELSRLVRCDLELAVASRRSSERRLVREIAAAAGAGVAGLFSLAALSWAAGVALGAVLPAWCVPLVVAGAWALIGLLLLRFEVARRRLFTRVSAGERESALAGVREERDDAESRVRSTARLLVRARTRELMDGGVNRAEHEADLLFRELLAMVVARGRSGFDLLERVVGRTSA